MISLKIESLPEKIATFIGPMECLQATKLPEGEPWLYEIKLDGYRAIAVKEAQHLTLFSRRKNALNRKFPLIVEALSELPEGTVLDGELVAMDENGRPNFNLLQNFKSKSAHVYYYVFDLLCCRNRSLVRVPLTERRKVLEEILPLSEHVRLSEQMQVTGAEMLAAALKLGLEGVVAKRSTSFYESGERSGSWVKVRMNRGQEFVIGGFTAGPHGIDSVIVGYYIGAELFFVAKIRNGFVPVLRRQVFEKLTKLVTEKCPFVNLPEKQKGRWGQGLTLEDMRKCVWVRPKLVAQIEFLEWTGADHLRHARFISLRTDKRPRDVTKE